MTGQAKYKQFIKIAEKRTQRVLEDLATVGARVLRTDQTGCVTLGLSGGRRWTQTQL